MANKWMTKLQKHSAVVNTEYNPFAHVIRTPSPSVNFVFGNTHGLPLGYSSIWYGPPKAGKSLIANMIIGQLHRDDPEAIVLKFNTEMRELGQLTPQQAAVWGIDRERYVAYDTNIPHEIFDFIEKEVNAMCQDGAPIKLIIIDSITGIRGRRDLNAEGIDNVQIGDDAKTIQDGLKRILSTIRRHKIHLLLTTHVRAELDMLEQKRGNSMKMAGAWALKHFAEHFIFVEPNRTKAGRTDFFGKEFVDDGLKDLNDKAEKIGHKIRVTMKDSSVGPKGRVGEFTLDYDRGLVNIEEEVFQLGVKRGIIERPNNVTYAYKGQTWRGKEALYNAIRDNDELRAEVIKEVIRMDVEKREPPKLAANGDFTPDHDPALMTD